MVWYHTYQPGMVPYHTYDSSTVKTPGAGQTKETVDARDVMLEQEVACRPIIYIITYILSIVNSFYP